MIKNIAIVLICLVGLAGCQNPTSQQTNVKEKNCKCSTCTCTDGHRCGPKCNCKPAQ